jgi:hypothetical protein
MRTIPKFQLLGPKIAKLYYLISTRSGMIFSHYHGYCLLDEQFFSVRFFEPTDENGRVE